MGLDNGIILYRKPVPDLSTKESMQIFKKDDKYLKEVNLKEYDYFIELEYPMDLCYWRKCWNIREAILSVINKPDNEGLPDNCLYVIDKDDINAIVRNLIKLYNKEAWESNNDSIWEFNEIADQLVVDIINIKMLKKFLEQHPDIIAVFYDSF